MAALALLRYWREGVIAALLILCAILYLSGKAADRRAAKFQGELAVANAMIETQNEAVERMAAEGKARSEAARKALQEAKRATAEAEVTARSLEAERPLSGRCETPPDVLRADL